MFYIQDLNKIKSFLPIIYTAYDLNSVSKLVFLYDNIKKIYKNINFFFVFHDEIAKIFDCEFIYPQSFYEKNNLCFVKKYYLESNSKMDVVEKFCEDNNINIFITRSSSYNSNKILLQPNSKTEFWKNKLLLQFNKTVSLSDHILQNHSADVVFAGIETPDLLTLAYKKRKIILLKEYEGSNSFQKMFPDTVSFK